MTKVTINWENKKKCIQTYPIKGWKLFLKIELIFGFLLSAPVFNVGLQKKCHTTNLLIYSDPERSSIHFNVLICQQKRITKCWGTSEIQTALRGQEENWTISDQWLFNNVVGYCMKSFIILCSLSFGTISIATFVC